MLLNKCIIRVAIYVMLDLIGIYHNVPIIKNVLFKNNTLSKEY
jgi:hypothetical protein